jgi:protein-S-isoprenylcysteine O-methyltransferase Ste14
MHYPVIVILSMKIYVLLVMAWIAYLSLHSVFASDGVKEYFKKLLGSGYRFYRMAYVILSIAGLFAVLMLNAVASQSYLFSNAGFARYASLVLTAAGVIVIRMAFKEYDMRGFLGFRPDDSESFKRTGILQYVRHPIYLGTILIVLGFFLFSPSTATLLSCLCIFVYLVAGIVLEERKLVRKYGDQYREYQKEVPAVFPGLRKK